MVLQRKLTVKACMYASNWEGLEHSEHLPSTGQHREKMGCGAPAVHGRQGQKASGVQGIRFPFRLGTELMSQD